MNPQYFYATTSSQRALLFNSLSLAAIQEIHSTKTSFYYVSQGHCPNLEVLEKQLLSTVYILGQ